METKRKEEKEKISLIPFNRRNYTKAQKTMIKPPHVIDLLTGPANKVTINKHFWYTALCEFSVITYIATVCIINITFISLKKWVTNII